MQPSCELRNVAQDKVDFIVLRDDSDILRCTSNPVRRRRNSESLGIIDSAFYATLSVSVSEN